VIGAPMGTGSCRAGSWRMGSRREAVLRANDAREAARKSSSRSNLMASLALAVSASSITRVIVLMTKLLVLSDVNNYINRRRLLLPVPCLPHLPVQ
jgi:hypothetical protein